LVGERKVGGEEGGDYNGSMGGQGRVKRGVQTTRRKRLKEKKAVGSVVRTHPKRRVTLCRWGFCDGK